MQVERSVETRDLSLRELNIIRRLLETPFPGRDELSAQLAHTRARPQEEHGDNCGTVSLVVDSAAVAPVLERVPVEASGEDADGMQYAVLLHVVDGLLNELEFYKYDGSSFEAPPVADGLSVRATEWTRAEG